MDRRFTIIGLGAFLWSLYLVAYARNKGLSAEQWAAWIQAVFSVIAILAAIGLAAWERHRELERAAVERRKSQFERGVLKRQQYATMMEISRLAIDVFHRALNACGRTYAESEGNQLNSLITSTVALRKMFSLSKRRWMRFVGLMPLNWGTPF